MKRLGMILAAILLLAAPSAFASTSSWCSPEYATCTEDSKDGTGTVPGGGNLRDGSRTYGAHYASCTAIYPARCLECSRNPRNNAPQCGYVNHDAHCECTETVRNYIVTACDTYGWCTYRY